MAVSTGTSTYARHFKRQGVFLMARAIAQRDVSRHVSICAIRPAHAAIADGNTPRYDVLESSDSCEIAIWMGSLGKSSVCVGNANSVPASRTMSMIANMNSCLILT